MKTSIPDSPPNDLQVDSGSTGDNDSSLGDVDGQSQRTESILSANYEFRFEGGRRFHGYDWQNYILPNDDAEQNRLDLQHQLFRLGIDGRLHLAPVPKDIHNVLDIGTGTGIWAIEFADEYPSAAVLGIDLSPIQPDYVPVNCSFRVDNAEHDWPPNEVYDLIHTRAMLVAISNWQKLIHQAFAHLRPGGFLEMHDFCLPSKVLGDEELPESRFMQYSEHIMTSLGTIGKNMSAPRLWKGQLEAAGFVDVHVKWVRWPVGTWAKGKRNKLLGKMLWQDFYHGVDTVAPLLTKIMQWDEERVKQFLQETREEMQTEKYHIFMEVVYIYARKPDAVPAKAEAATQEN